MGRVASHKEGESWGIIAKLSSASIRRSCVMQSQSRRLAAGASPEQSGEPLRIAPVGLHVVAGFLGGKQPAAARKLCSKGVA
jgi:hypothetical protein